MVNDGGRQTGEPMREERLLDVVGQLYDAATDATRLKTIGSLLAGEVASESSLVFMARKSSARLVQLVSASNNFDADAQSAYRAYYHDHNEWFLRGVRLPPPIIVRGAELIDYRDFDRTEFCSDWCRKVGIYHLLAATFAIEDGVIGAIGIHRERAAEAFSDDNKRFLAAIAPHLMRVLQIARKLGVFARDADLTLDVLQGLGVAVLLLDGECRPVFMNAVAEKLVRTARYLTMSNGRIRTVHPASSREFERKVNAAFCTGSGPGRGIGVAIRLHDPFGGSLPALVTPFQASGLDIGPLQRLVAIILSDLDGATEFSGEAIAQIYGLTSAEGRLVAALAGGRSMAGYARRTGISVNTAKAQLRSVFLKTGVSRQSALVGLVLANPVLRLHGVLGVSVR
jgi:DNA-binding CsgD family transcriptional regulator